MNLINTTLKFSVRDVTAEASCVRTGAFCLCTTSVQTIDLSVSSAPLQALSLPVFGFVCPIKNNSNSFSINVSAASVYTIISEKVFSFAAVVKGVSACLIRHFKRKFRAYFVPHCKQKNRTVRGRTGVLRL